MLSELSFPFSLIGLTETKLKFDHAPLLNTDLQGYQFVSQPRHSNAGGVGFYINDNLAVTIRSDLTISKNEFEALWIEVQNARNSNLICGVL